MAETTLNSALLTRDLPLIRVKMTYQGPHVIAGDEQSDDDREEPELFARMTAVDSPSRDILPISTGVPILPTQSAQISYHIRIPDRPQTWIYKIDRCAARSARPTQAMYNELGNAGGQVAMWKVGHSLIKVRMKETGAALADEMSGHMFFAHRGLWFDDGCTAARVAGA
jgi:hypothetical protein